MGGVVISRRSFFNGLPEDADLTAQARALMLGLGAVGLASKVTVRWNARMRSTAGLAYYSKSLILLNPKLIGFGANEVDQTFRHELAHLLARDRAGSRRIKPHGVEWKRACLDLGIGNESRCHNLALPRRQVQRKHFYQCPECKVVLRRARPLRGRAACLACCRKLNGGQYDARFQWLKIPIESI